MHLRMKSVSGWRLQSMVIPLFGRRRSKPSPVAVPSRLSLLLIIRRMQGIRDMSGGEASLYRAVFYRGSWGELPAQRTAVTDARFHRRTILVVASWAILYAAALNGALLISTFPSPRGLTVDADRCPLPISASTGSGCSSAWRTPHWRPTVADVGVQASWSGRGCPLIRPPGRDPVAMLGFVRKERGATGIGGPGNRSELP